MGNYVFYGRGIYHVACNVAEEQREPGSLLHYVNQARFIADLPIVAADRGDGEMGAVWQSRAVDQDALAGSVHAFHPRKLLCPGIKLFDIGIVGRKEIPFRFLHAGQHKRLADSL